METENLDGRTYNLLFGIRRSVLYHGHRRRFYECWNTVTVTVAALGGFASVAALLSTLPNIYGIVMAGIVALLGALDLSVGTMRRANLHIILAQRFIALEKRFAASENLSDAEFAEIAAARLDIESNEPTALRLLDAMCHYQLLLSLGDARDVQFPCWRRWLAHWLSQADYVRRHVATAA